MNCPCGNEQPYDNCCGRLIEKSELPSTPEQLMRSRYTAYTLSKIDYIKNTMAGKALKKFDFASSLTWSQSIDWQNLKVIFSKIIDDTTGVVEFVAHYTHQNQPQKLSEISLFHRIDGQWVYVDTITRNQQCVCGKMKKFKSCCGRKK